MSEAAFLTNMASSLEEGASTVHFCGRNAADLETASEALSKQYPSQTIKTAIVDMSKPSDIKSWVESMTSLDIVVSNVSALSISNTPESWMSTFEIDMQGVVTLVNAALPQLEKNKGNVVTISSVSGRDVDFTAVSPYGAFKAALIHYTAQLAHTLAPKGVRANTISPGNIYIKDGVWGNIERNMPDLFKDQFAKNPMGRMGKPEEVANAVVFIASEKAGFISGANLNVDGSVCSGVQF